MSAQKASTSAERADVIKVFRVKAGFAGGLLSSLVFLLVGLSGLLPSTHAGPGGIAIGGLLVAFGLYLLAFSVIATRLVITNTGIIYWKRLKKNTIPWSSVRSFGIGLSRSLVHWPCLVIQTENGPARVDSIAGSRAFVERVIRDLDDIRRHGPGSAAA